MLGLAAGGGGGGMIADDFTFPVITTDNVVNLPPLWRISSINHDGEKGGRRRKMFAASFSGEITNIDKAEEAEAQEKMDVLWEDFNEELQLLDSSDSESSDDPNQIRHNNNSSTWREEEFETLEEECRELPRKKLESVVMMMKKLFLLHNNARRSGVPSMPQNEQEHI